MGIYLPTITCLIDNKDVPNMSIETWHDVEYLLAKYYKESLYYSCTTRGYRHIDEFSKIIDAVLNGVKTIYSEEVACLKIDKLEHHLKILIEVEKVFMEQPKLVKNILLNDEKTRYNLLEEYYKEKPKYKEHYKQRIQKIETLNLANIYKKATIQKEISEFNLQDALKDDYHPVISTVYWLKTQLFLTKQAIKHKKALLYVMLIP